MRVLVPGGTGCVGSHTVAALVERGHEVRLLVRQTLTLDSPVGHPPGHDLGSKAEAERVARRGPGAGRGPRRYLAGGTFVPLAEVVARLGAVTGRRLRAVTVPAGMLLPPHGRSECSSASCRSISRWSSRASTSSGARDVSPE